MVNKPPITVAEQINLLKSRGMLFKDEAQAAQLLKNVSYYRLKGYWWDVQDKTTHIFNSNTYFEDIANRYSFDRELRLILFDAIEYIEIALRTKMIYHLSISYGSLWYLNEDLMTDNAIHQRLLEDLNKEFDRSQEIFIKDHKYRYPNDKADVWKMLEVASMGTLSKLYKNLQHQLPEKAIIAKEMGLNLHRELSSWLEAISYIRNIIAHHSRLWSRSMVKIPMEQLNNPMGAWFAQRLMPAQLKKPFLIISTMVYLCGFIDANNTIKNRLLDLLSKNAHLPIYKLGFFNNWEEQPIWNA